MSEELSPLPDGVGALLRTARDAELPIPAGVEDAVLAKVALSVAPAAAVLGAAQLAGAGTKAAAWGAGKSLAALFVGAAVIGGGALVLTGKKDETAARAERREAPAPAVEPAEPPPAAAPPPAVAPAEPPPVAAAPVNAAPRRAADAAAEGQLLESAREALGRGDASRAREQLAEHERRFAGGQLAEERRALTVVALSQLGERDLAQAAARDFQERHPHSLFLEVVRAALAE